MIKIPPVLKTNDEKIKELIKETAEETTKKNAELFKTSQEGSGSKISQILRNVKEGQVTQQIDKQETKPEINQIEKKEEKHEEHKHEEHVNDELPCPTCKTGNVHKLEGTSNGRVKCSGPNCGLEYALIPTNADYQCTNCGSAHKKPVESNDSDICPFCSGNEFKKFDWNKLINKNKKK